VSLAVEPGECVGLVGESGSGKSTVGRALLGLEKPTSGQVYFDGQNIHRLKWQGLETFRRRAQMIFQDPMGSLNPRMTVGAAIGEVLDVHKIVPRRERHKRVADLLRQVGLEPEHMNRYPHEFSGGQRQRVGIARALSLSPAVIIADEPVSALDVSVQAQILNLMKDLQEQNGLAYLFIAHDLAVVNSMCRRVLVMYLGRIVESGDAETVFFGSAHPYTAALRAAVPDPDQPPSAERSRAAAKGDVPSAIAIPAGCVFHPRCPYAQPRCRAEIPLLRTVDPGHLAACHFAEDLRKLLAEPGLEPKA